MNQQLEIPHLLKEMMSWEKEIADKVSYLETPTSYFLSFNASDNGGYACSPADSIVFANTGMDGVHYSLLTDFGVNSDLNEAPVICVSPMDFDNQVRIVANNIRDFFTLSLLGHRDLLFNDFPTKQAYIKFMQKQEQELQEEREQPKESTHFDHHKWHQQQALVGELAMQRFQLQPIDDPFDYIARLRAKREAKIVLSTSNGLGIVGPTSKKVDMGACINMNEVSSDSDSGLDTNISSDRCTSTDRDISTASDISTGSSSKQSPSHPWATEEIPLNRLDELHDYIKSAELPELLAFVRDYQHQLVTNDELLRVLCQRLEQFELQLEARRLLHCMPSSDSFQSTVQHGSHHIAWWHDR